jgi:Polysaccharide biosynthesis/export protein
MNDCPQAVSRSPQTRRRVAALLLAFALAGAGGCAALTNPVAEGVPVRRLSPEWLTPPKDEEVCLPPALLTQPHPDVYRLAPGDVLGIWIDGVFPVPEVGGLPSAPPPVQPTPALSTDPRDQRRPPAAAGYPVAVEEDGTVSLPRVPPVPVAGLSLAEAQKAVRDTYTVKTDVLKAGNERVLVTLLQPRHYQVQVLRQEHTAFGVGLDGAPIPASKRGTGQLVELAAYENDVLHALTLTGGLPGTDVCDEVIIQRHLALPPGCPPPPGPRPSGGPGVQTVRIPLRLRPGEEPPFRPEDVVLHSGDVVVLQPRVYEVFYTGGLLPPGEHVLPRDRDLDVLEAVAQVRGPILNGAFNINNLAGNILAPGLGSPSPALLVVLRQTPGGQLPIRVDLDRALTDPRERILVRPGDVLLLQERPGDALGRYVTETFLNFSLSWQLVHGRWVNGVTDVSAPERIPSRIGITNFTGSAATFP